jgi:predicted PurR-regulated permease PerM
VSISERKALRFVAFGLVLAAVVTIAPFWVPLVLAAWTADLLQPSMRRLQAWLGGRRRGAAAIVVLLVVAALVPLAFVVAVVVIGVRDLILQLTAAIQGQGTLGSVLLGGGPAHSPTFREWADLLSRYGENAWHAVTLVAQTSFSLLLGVLIFVATLYAFASTGSASYRWMLQHSPIPTKALHRFMLAFRETGRGLLIGSGGTALIQGAVATVAYIVIGIPRALLLGPLTAIAALVPALGTGLVWVPLAIELALSKHYVRAGLIAAVGAGLISLIDNFVRPVLTRYGKLNLPTSIVLLSMLGGLAVFGASGVILGPLIVRLAAEALAIVRESRLFLPEPTRERPSLPEVVRERARESPGHAVPIPHAP